MARTGHTDSLFVPVSLWPWPDDLYTRICVSRCIYIPKMNFLSQGFRKLSYYRHTHRQIRPTLPRRFACGNEVHNGSVRSPPLCAADSPATYGASWLINFLRQPSRHHIVSQDFSRDDSMSVIPMRSVGCIANCYITIVPWNGKEYENSLVGMAGQ